MPGALVSLSGVLLGGLLAAAPALAQADRTIAARVELHAVPSRTPSDAAFLVGDRTAKHPEAYRQVRGNPPVFLREVLLRPR